MTMRDALRDSALLHIFVRDYFKSFFGKMSKVREKNAMLDAIRKISKFRGRYSSLEYILNSEEFI